jgi:hypothetical protein
MRLSEPLITNVDIAVSFELCDRGMSRISLAQPVCGDGYGEEFGLN